MKKTTIIFLVAFVLFGLQAAAQTNTMADSSTVFSIADSAAFTGRYRFENLPFEYITLSVQDGKLYYSGGEYSGALNPVKDKKDVFGGNDNAVFTFVRNTESKITEMDIEYQSQIYTGKKEEEENIIH